MRILIDGDGFPDVKKVIDIAKKYNISIIVYMDFNHEFYDDYAIIKFISPGNNAVDLEIQNQVIVNDLVLTNDYGVAVIALSKNTRCLNSNGFEYSNDNIDSLLERRYMNMKLRRTCNVKGPKKRTTNDTLKLLNSIENVILESKNEKKF